MSDYSVKLRDPRWQRKRLEIFQRDNWTCQHCHIQGKTLTVHHAVYMPGLDPWEHSDATLLTLCDDCHSAGLHEPVPECHDCGAALTNETSGGSDGGGRMADGWRHVGICRDCAEIREVVG